MPFFGAYLLGYFKPNKESSLILVNVLYFQKQH